MRQSLLTLIIALACQGLLDAADAEVRLMVIGAFGQPRDGCEVEAFRNLDQPLPGGGYRDYRTLFRGLEGRRLPFARYEVTIRCGEKFRGSKEVQIDLAQDFEVVATSERLFRMHDRKPTLTIAMKRQPKGSETWWIRMIGLFVSSDITARFAPAATEQDLEATVFDPQPGRYAIVVMSSSGYICSRRIDVYDAPKRWTFDPLACEFGLDSRATHVEQR